MLPGKPQRSRAGISSKRTVEFQYLHFWTSLRFHAAVISINLPYCRKPPLPLTAVTGEENRQEVSGHFIFDLSC
jgi:hypothetical protein